MSWRIRVRHRTGYTYPSPVRSSYNEARMTPPTSHGQQTLEARLELQPASTPLRYVDYWGTIVHAFDVHQPHTALSVTASAIVETATPVPDPPDIGWADVREPAAQDAHAELLLASRYVVAEPDVSAAAARFAGQLGPAEAGRRVVAWAHGQLAYERGATEVHTTSAQARAAGRGVCQDYTHVALSALRSMGLPAATSRATCTRALRRGSGRRPSGRATPGSSTGPAPGWPPTRPAWPRSPSGTSPSRAAGTTPTYARCPVSTAARARRRWTSASSSPGCADGRCPGSGPAVLQPDTTGGESGRAGELPRRG